MAKDSRQAKDELDEILNDMKVEGRVNDAQAFNALKDKNISSIVKLDYVEVKRLAEKKATQHVDSIVKFYLYDDGDIKDDFLKHKTNRDKFRLAKQIVQLEIAEHAIAKLNEEIDNGNLNPRLWEVMGSMMKSFDSMNITYAKMEILIENNYKGVQEDIEYKKQLAGNVTVVQPKQLSEQTPQSLTSTGHKALLQQIRQNIAEKDSKKNVIDDFEID